MADSDRKLTESTLSSLLLRAVADIRAAENTPGVALNMCEWVSATDGNGSCEVCMAGAVMIGLDPGLMLDGGDLSAFDNDSQVY